MREQCAKTQEIRAAHQEKGGTGRTGVSSLRRLWPERGGGLDCLAVHGLVVEVVLAGLADDGPVLLAVVLDELLVAVVLRLDVLDRVRLRERRPRLLAHQAAQHRQA